MAAPVCPECGDECEAEAPLGDGCLCMAGDCLFCDGGCSGQL